ncbi:VWA containing CoxE family protein [Ammonifex degensii KC4]|uniref:VWA containing CoxE family protein n=1 Tax=Ammonifex degensii (strain DSM 10501 / KC4) TaxID=429009 RepID=C9RCL7_AMMDK|nr:VWA domain-containing protein [Ammonifex degensii]ACX51994.1 VWA containing CoxE family protein [Ammonifex degensii KC4]
MLTDTALSSSLTRFAARLRERGMMVSPAEVADAVEAVRNLVPLSLRELRGILRPCMAKTPGDIAVFEDVFDEFFLGEEEVIGAAAALACQAKRARGRGCPPGGDTAQGAGDGESRPGGEAQGWKKALQEDPSVPDSVRKFVAGDRLGAAVALAHSPLTEDDRRAVADAVLRAASSGALGRDALEELTATLKEFAELAAAVERRRRRTPGDKKFRPPLPAVSPARSLPAGAWEWDAGLPEHLLRARLEGLDARTLAWLTGEIERAAASLRPLLERSCGVVRRRLGVDYRETMRLSLATFGEPFRIAFSARRRKLRRIVTVCDISGSVKKVAGLMLAFMYGLHRAFSGRVRHFVFVSEVDEVTPYFACDSYAECFDRVTTSAAVDYYGYSDYGKALTLLWKRHRDAFDHETLAIFLGDARTNRRDPKAGVLAELAARTRKTFFLNPEDPSKWGTGDSVAFIYREVVEMRDVSTLERLVAFLKMLPGMVVVW